MNPREELKRFLSLFMYKPLFARRGPKRPAAVNPKRRAERAERQALGIKTGKQYRAFKKLERRKAA